MRRLSFVLVAAVIFASCADVDNNWSSYGGGPGARQFADIAVSSSVSRQWDHGFQRLMSMVWPVADSDFIYAIVDNPLNSFESVMVKVSKQTGIVEGQPFSLGQSANYSLIVSPQSIIITDGQKITKHDKETMNMIWEHQLDDEENVFQITSIKDMLFFVTDRANVICLNRDTGMVRWQQKADDRYNYRWCASNGEISVIEGFIPDGNMKVMAFGTYSGEFLWEFETEGDASVPAQISGNKVAISSTGQIVMLDIETGGILWSMLVRDASGLPVKLTKPGCFLSSAYYLVNGNRLIGADIETGTLIDEARIPFDFPAISMAASGNAIFIALYGDPFLIAYSLNEKSFTKQIEGKRTVIGMAVSDGLAVQCVESLMFFR